MPDPRPGEPRDDFVSRCIPVVLDDGTAEDNDQAVAICNRVWEDANKSEDNTMEHKTFSGLVTKADEEQGIVEAIFAVMGNIDKGKDVIHLGAFTKTFAERGHRVKLIDSHRTDSINAALGKILDLGEVGRDKLPAELLSLHPGATGGARSEMKFNLKTQAGHDAFQHVKAGDVDEWSFGYDALDVDFSQAVEDGQEINVRNLRTIKLYEISPVLFGMNEATTTLSAKAEDEKNVSEIMHDAGASGIWAESDLATTGINPFGGKGASEDTKIFPIGDGRYILALDEHVSRECLALITKRLREWEAGDDKFLVINSNVKLMKIDEQTETAPPQEAAREHDQAQAGPQDAPTSKELLDELELLKLQTQTLEVTQ